MNVKYKNLSDIKPKFITENEELFKLLNIKVKSDRVKGKIELFSNDIVFLGFLETNILEALKSWKEIKEMCK